MTLLEGKYHQVKRMLAAAGNTVQALHRSDYGALSLPADLSPGQWRWLDGPAVLFADPGAGPGADLGADLVGEPPRPASAPSRGS